VVCVWDMQTGLLATAFKCDKPCSVLLWGSRMLPPAYSRACSMRGVCVCEALTLG
jgi:hypothetical protein